MLPRLFVILQVISVILLQVISVILLQVISVILQVIPGYFCYTSGYPRLFLLYYTPGYFRLHVVLHVYSR